MKRAALLLSLCLAVAVVVAVSLAPKPAEAADLWKATLVPGADAGSVASLNASWLPGNQFMLSCTAAYSGVTYRLCPAVDAGLCSAQIADAPIEAGKQIDLCAPTAYTALSVYKAYDGGNPSCSVFLVTPKTVCQTP